MQRAIRMKGGGQGLMRSPLSSWIGGKMRLSREIIRRIPAHEAYIEPFCGAAWVYFRKNPSPVEILNDINGDIINFYEQIRDHLPEFLARARYVLVSRRLFLQYREEGLANLPDLERAFRFWYLLKCSFGGRMHSAVKKYERGQKRTYRPSFGIINKCKEFRLRVNISRSEWERWHERMLKTTLEALPWQEMLARYDRPSTFFYIDPPYFGCESYYGTDFCRQDFAALARALAGIKGKFLLSINNAQEMRELFAGFPMETVAASYSLNEKSVKNVRELLVRNYTLPENASGI